MAAERKCISLVWNRTIDIALSIRRRLAKDNVCLTAIALSLCLSLGHIACAAGAPVVQFTKADLATANGSARIGIQSGNLACVLTSIETRVQLEPNKWDSDDEATSWTTWLTAFDDNLISKWLKNAPLNGQETVGIRINPDGSVDIANNTFFAGPGATDPTAKSTFEASISTCLNQTLKMAKPMPPTKNKLKEVHMSLTFMREPRSLPEFGQNDYGYVAVLGAKNYVTVYERTSSDGRFPGIQILSDAGEVVPLEQADFDKKVTEIAQLPQELPGPTADSAKDPAAAKDQVQSEQQVKDTAAKDQVQSEQQAKGAGAKDQVQIEQPGKDAAANQVQTEQPAKDAASKD